VPPIAKCGWSRRAAGYEVRSVRGVPWSVRCGYLRSFDFGSYYQSTPRAAAVRVQLVQGSSGTCLRCTPRLWRVGETGIAHFSPGTEKTLPWRRGLPRDAPRAAGPRTKDPDRADTADPSRTNPVPTGPTAHRRLAEPCLSADRQSPTKLRPSLPQSAARRPPLFLRSTALLAFSQISLEISHWSPWLGAEAIVVTSVVSSVVTSVVTSALARLGGGRWVGG
jgi:hypothetical protein